MNPQRSLDLPLDGATTESGVLRIAGWAAGEDVARVELTVDGVTTLAQPFAHPRPDVADVLTGHPDALMCGFDASVPVDQSRGRRDILVVATEISAEGDRRPIGSRNVTLTGPSDAPSQPSFDDEYLRALRSRVSRSSRSVSKAPRGAGSDLNILVVTHDLGLGGGQLYLTELLTGLVASPGLSFTVVCPGDGPLRIDLEAKGIAVHLAGPFVTTPIAYECLLRELAGIARDIGADAVIANSLGAFCGADLASRLALPSLWAIHESYPLGQYWTAAHGPAGVDPYFDAQARYALASASAVIFEAESTRRLFVEHGDPLRFVKVDYGIPIEAIDLYVETVDRSALRSGHGFSDRQVVVLCMGTIEPRKGQVGLIRAFARLADRYTDAVLVLVGHRGDAYGDFVATYVEEVGLGERVRLVPVGADSYDWYLMADAFALASSIESLPRSVLEAMAFRLPILATDAFGLGELIDDGVSGVTFAASDAAATVAALDRLLALTSIERSSLGRRGEAIVRAGYDSSGYVKAYRSLLSGLADDPSLYPADLLAGPGRPS